MNKKIALIYGGRSVEHGVSVNSAKNIAAYIDRFQFDPIFIGISTAGEWYLTENVSKDISTGKPLLLNLSATKPAFVEKQSGTLYQPDVVFPVLHGTDGEDGSIQGLIKALNLPMVGSSVLGSSVAMNKIIAKRLLKAQGIPVAPFITCHYTERDKMTFQHVSTTLGLPFMVKAACLGSSVGVSKVKDENGFLEAMEDSFRYDDTVLLETYIQGREIECALLGNQPPIASLPGEIVIDKKYEFYTYEAKYVDADAVKINVPAELDPQTVKAVRDIAVRSFLALQCEDFARVDLFLDKDSNIFVNEINTIPGFTNSSMYPMMWQERGIGFTELITRLIDFALERFQHTQRIERGYTSALKF